MNRPDYTNGGDVADALKCLLHGPMDWGLCDQVAADIAKHLKAFPALAPWYHLPILAMMASALHVVTSSKFYRAVPNEPTAETAPRPGPEHLRDVVKLGRLDGELRAILPNEVPTGKIEQMAEAAMAHWCEFDGASEDGWLSLVVLVLGAVTLGNDGRPY